MRYFIVAAAAAALAGVAGAAVDLQITEVYEGVSGTTSPRTGSS